jgi:hypothetical protein
VLRDNRQLCLSCLDSVVVDTQDAQPLYAKVCLASVQAPLQGLPSALQEVFVRFCEPCRCAMDALGLRKPMPFCFVEMQTVKSPSVRVFLSLSHRSSLFP